MLLVIWFQKPFSEPRRFFDNTFLGFPLRKSFPPIFHFCIKFFLLPVKFPCMCFSHVSIFASSFIQQGCILVSHFLFIRIQFIIILLPHFSQFFCLAVCKGRCRLPDIPVFLKEFLTNMISHFIHIRVIWVQYLWLGYIQHITDLHQLISWMCNIWIKKIRML